VSATAVREKREKLRGKRIGHGVTMRFFIALNPETKESERAGIIIAHRHADGAICQGGVQFAVPANQRNERPKWAVESWRPLTLAPSIFDPDCGLHGYVRAGRWVPT
jgi:hypothetical protein